MEYFLGSIITLACVVVVNKLVKRQKPITGTIEFSQSHLYAVLAPFMPSNEELSKPKHTQASKYLDNVFFRVIIVGKNAYWIKDNVFYEADVLDGDVDRKTARQVDTMAMDKVQLNKMMSIVERLTEGTHNDYWDSGKS
jgi:heptaprenylglyceryl phosphate synthase